MPYVSPVVEADFKDRLTKCTDIIKKSGIKYQSFGIYGSYTRNNYKATDVVFVTPQYFKYDNSKFTQQLRRDFREIKWW